MKKRLAILGVGTVAGGFMLLSAAYTGMAETGGYDALKQAVKTTKKAESVTTAVELTVQDNGKQVIEVDAESKRNRKLNTASFTATIGRSQQNASLNVYHTGDQVVLKPGDSDVYTVIEKDENDRWFEERRQHHPEMSEEFENLVDALVGELKNHVTMERQADGKRTIELEMSGSQIPAVVKAAGSLVVKAASQHDANQPQHSQMQNPAASIGDVLHQQLPELVEDISIDRIRMQAEVDQANYITGKTVVLTVTGKDASGAMHELVVELDAELSGYNETTPETVSLEGKQVQTFDRETMKTMHKSHR